MLPPIDLNDHPQLMACEVRKIRTDRCLTAKMMLLEWRLPQALP
jgi:hypothetical protein